MGSRAAEEPKALFRDADGFGGRAEGDDPTEPGLTSAEKYARALGAGTPSMEKLTAEAAVALLRGVREWAAEHKGVLPGRFGITHIAPGVRTSLGDWLIARGASSGRVPDDAVQLAVLLDKFIDEMGSDLSDTLRGVARYRPLTEGRPVSENHAKMAVVAVARQVEEAYRAANAASRKAADARARVTRAFLQALPGPLATHVVDALSLGPTPVLPASMCFEDLRTTALASVTAMFQSGKVELRTCFDVASSAGSGTSPTGGAGAAPARRGTKEYRPLVVGRPPAAAAVVPDGDGRQGKAPAPLGRGVGPAARPFVGDKKASGGAGCFNCGAQGHRKAECSLPCQAFARHGKCEYNDRCPLKATHKQ